MPGILDRSTQILNELLTTRMFGEEIEKMSLTNRQAAKADLLALLEKAVSLTDLQEFNERCRKWVDAHPLP